MYVVFAVSLILQLALAAHAYQHGRASPWLWIILFFPLAGGLLYAFLFLLPRVSRGSTSRRFTDDERKLRRVPRGPFAPAGERPDDPIVVTSAAEIEVHAGREDCPECGHALKVDEHRAETIRARRLRVVVLECPACGALPVRYFEIEGPAQAAALH